MNAGVNKRPTISPRPILPTFIPKLKEVYTNITSQNAFFEILWYGAKGVSNIGKKTVPYRSIWSEITANTNPDAASAAISAKYLFP